MRRTLINMPRASVDKWNLYMRQWPWFFVRMALIQPQTISAPRHWTCSLCIIIPKWFSSPAAPSGCTEMFSSNSPDPDLLQPVCLYYFLCAWVSVNPQLPYSLNSVPTSLLKAYYFSPLSILFIGVMSVSATAHPQDSIPHRPVPYCSAVYLLYK